MQEQLAAPIEKIAFAGVEVRGDLVFVGGGDEFAFLFLHLREQVMELGRIFLFQKVLQKLAGIRQAIADDKSKGQIIAIIVGGRIDALGFFEIRRSGSNFSGAHVQLAKIVIGIVAHRLQLKSFLEFRLRNHSGEFMIFICLENKFLKNSS